MGAKRTWPQDSKRCVRCGAMKPTTAFYKSGTTRSGFPTFKSECKPCSVERARWDQMKTKYGLTREAFEMMLAAQGGGCAICGRTAEQARQRDTYLSVDHDHGDGSVRSLLCTHCNVGLGAFADDPERLLVAAAYLIAAAERAPEDDGERRHEIEGARTRARTDPHAFDAWPGNGK